MTLNQVIQRVKTLALSHKQINHFYFGDAAEWLNNGDVTYPACFLDIVQSVVDRDNKQTVFTFELVLADLTNVSGNSRENETEVLSDLTSVAEDMAAMFNDTSYQDDWTIGATYPLQYFTEEFEDWTAGVRMTVDIGVNFLSNRCQVPAEDVEFEPETGNPANGRDTKVYKYTYEGTGGEGAGLSTALTGKEILLVFKGDKLLVKKDSTEGLEANDYHYQSATGVFTFGNDIEYRQVIQIIYRAL